MKAITSPTPRIYVRCLAAYNAGTLHGTWIDADQDADAINDDVQAMLANSPEEGAEEWAIHDQEGFGNVTLSESESFERVSQMAEFIDEHKETGLSLLAHYSGDIEEAAQAMENYLGTYPTLGAYAEEMNEGLEIPAAIVPYVDYERMGSDWEINGDIFTIKLGFDKVLVFANR